MFSLGTDRHSSGSVTSQTAVNRWLVEEELSHFFRCHFDMKQAKFSPLKTLDFFLHYTSLLPSFFFLSFFIYYYFLGGEWKTMGLSFFPGKTVLQETVHWDVSRKLLQAWKLYKCSSCPAKAIIFFIFKPLTLKQSTLMTSRRWYHWCYKIKAWAAKSWELCASHPQWKPWGFGRWHSSLSDQSSLASDCRHGIGAFLSVSLNSAPENSQPTVLDFLI